MTDVPHPPERLAQPERPERPESPAGRAQFLHERRSALARSYCADPAGEDLRAAGDVLRRAGDAVGAMARRCAGSTGRAADDQVLLESVVRLEHTARAVHAAQVPLLARIDREQTSDRLVGLRTNSWLAANTALPRHDCGRRVRTASVLDRHLPIVQQALADGRIGPAHADLLARSCHPRLLEVVIELQDQLLALADGVRFEVWAREVRDLLALADQDGGHTPPPGTSRVTVRHALDGDVVLSGELVGDDAVTFAQLLEEATDRAFVRAQRDRERCSDLPLPTRAQLRATALVELVRRGHSAAVPSRAPATDVTLVVDASDLRRWRTAPGPDATAHVLGATPASLFACDPALTALVVDSLGVPLDLGHRVRFATDGQRRAVFHRDGGCVFPGCDAPTGWCDVHHVVHVVDGGPTDVGNLASLCRHHHRVTHRHGWSMRSRPDQWFEWSTPSGSRLRSQRHGRAAPPG